MVLKSYMAQSGAHREAGVALLTELMAAALTDAVLGDNATPFPGAADGPRQKNAGFFAVDHDVTRNGLLESSVFTFRKPCDHRKGVYSG